MPPLSGFWCWLLILYYNNFTRPGLKVHELNICILLNASLTHNRYSLIINPNGIRLRLLICDFIPWGKPLKINHYSFPITHNAFITAFHHFQLSTFNFQFSIVNCQLSTVHCPLSIILIPSHPPPSSLHSF